MEPVVQTSRKRVRGVPRRWFVVQADALDERAPVVVLSAHSSEQAARAAQGKARRRLPAGVPAGEVVLRRDEDIVSRLEWDEALSKGVVRPGPPPHLG